MKRMRFMAMVIAGATIISALVGCGSSSSNTTTSTTAKTEASAEEKASGKTEVASGDLFDVAKYKSNKDKSEWTIAVVTKDNTSAWFKRMEVGVNRFGKDTSINVIQKGPATADAASQVEVVDQMIDQGVDAICVVPIDPGALEASLQRAMEAGIVVVSHEASNLENTLFDIEAFTAKDFGYAIMDELAKSMNEEGKYAEMAVSYTHLTLPTIYSV